MRKFSKRIIITGVALLMGVCMFGCSSATSDSNNTDDNNGSVETVTDNNIAESNQDDVVENAFDAAEPTFDCFEAVEGYLKDGIPFEAHKMDAYDSFGDWKYELIFDDDDEANIYKEIGTMFIDAGQDEITVSLNAMETADAFEKHNVEPGEFTYESMTGAIDEHGLSVQSAEMTVVIEDFFEVNEILYAVGAVTTSEGRIGSILLQR